MKLEAIVVCVDYSDYLEHTLPDNLNHLDRLVVVTSPTDKKTQALCSKYSVDCVQTEAMYENGSKFNKGRCINIGLGYLQGADWILQLDADILLPHRFRDMLARTQLDSNRIYGADRFNVFGYEAFEKIKPQLAPHYVSQYFVQPPHGLELGARIIHHEHGYTPIGYFQLFHKSSGRRYSISSGNAEHTDVLFAIQWSRVNRILLPEVLVYHLDSLQGPAPMGANWEGRTTPLFGPGPDRHRHHHPIHHPKPPPCPPPPLPYRPVHPTEPPPHKPWK